jgi:hypothetical protein
VCCDCLCVCDATLLCARRLMGRYASQRSVSSWCLDLFDISIHLQFPSTFIDRPLAPHPLFSPALSSSFAPSLALPHVSRRRITRAAAASNHVHRRLCRARELRVGRRGHLCLGRPQVPIEEHGARRRRSRAPHHGHRRTGVLRLAGRGREGRRRRRRTHVRQRRRRRLGGEQEAAA